MRAIGPVPSEHPHIGDHNSIASARPDGWGFAVRPQTPLCNISASHNPAPTASSLGEFGSWHISAASPHDERKQVIRYYTRTAAFPRPPAPTKLLLYTPSCVAQGPSSPGREHTTGWWGTPLLECRHLLHNTAFRHALCVSIQVRAGLQLENLPKRLAPLPPPDLSRLSLPLPRQHSIGVADWAYALRHCEAGWEHDCS